MVSVIVLRLHLSVTLEYIHNNVATLIRENVTFVLKLVAGKFASFGHT